MLLETTNFKLLKQNVVKWKLYSLTFQNINSNVGGSVRILEGQVKR